VAIPKFDTKSDVQALSGFGEILRRTGVVTQEQLDEARKLATYKSMRTGEALLALGHITQEQLDWALRLQRQLRSGDRRAVAALNEVMNASLAAASVALARWVSG
jgi:hypothetical protein